MEYTVSSCGEKYFHCPVCKHPSSVLTSLENIKWHLRFQCNDKGTDVYQCVDCNAVFSSKEELHDCRRDKTKGLRARYYFCFHKVQLSLENLVYVEKKNNNVA